MPNVTSTEFQRNPGRYQDLAQREPVMVMAHGRERTVLLSAEEYRRLKRRDRQALAVEEISDGDMAAILAGEVPAEYAHLDGELEG
jgi:prevent-host-death family protein